MVSDSASEDLSRSFAPLATSNSRILVLGTMPGQKSLNLQQYYAHPRNALWPILCALSTHTEPRYEVHQELSYEQRCTLITDAGFALWDVLASCKRPGSLDGQIVRGTEIPNRIPQFISTQARLQAVVCNGRTAEALFKRYVQPQSGSACPTMICLPSTSPAMASLSLQQKFILWRDALAGFQETSPIH